MYRPAALLLIVLIASTQTLGQTALTDEFTNCVMMSDDARRLACFDAYAKRIDNPPGDQSKGQASEQPDVRVAGQTDDQSSEQVGRKEQPGPVSVPLSDDTQMQDEQIKQRENFGLTTEEIARRQAAADSSGTYTRAAEKREEEGISARVANFTRLARSNNIRITLDNGQIWQEIDGAPFRGSVSPGTEVTVSKRRFGGYKMAVPGRSRPILVRRIK